MVPKRQNGCSVVPEHPFGTPWAESRILDEPDVLHGSYPAVSSQILLTTTTTAYGCLRVEVITACHFFYTYLTLTTRTALTTLPLLTLIRAWLHLTDHAT